MEPKSLTKANKKGALQPIDALGNADSIARDRLFSRLTKAIEHNEKHGPVKHLYHNPKFDKKKES